ncbi:MAG: phenylalanine--tRNA ligase subunit beta [Planctomycetota bacterium]
MKVSLQWLADYVDIALAPEELAARLTMAGVPVASILPVGDDHVLELEITSNRPDLLSHIGVAREIAALRNIPFRTPADRYPEGREPIAKHFRLDVRDADLCPRYIGRLITGAKIGPSPAWMARRLEAVGIRAINNVVDITNYVLLEYGQPLHAFDADAVAGRHIIVRRAAPGETMPTLDGILRKFTPDDLLIADETGPVAVAGVMGGARSEISSATTALFLESALFDPRAVRRTSRSLGLATESSYRFERKVDANGVEAASRRVIALIREFAGGEAARGKLEVAARRAKMKPVTLSVSRLAATLGKKVSATAVRGILRRIGMTAVRGAGDRLAGVPPSHRSDLQEEVDLVEEVARLTGYPAIPEQRNLLIATPAASPAHRSVRRLRDTLAALGYDECLTTSFLAPDRNALISPWTDRAPLVITNPVNRAENTFRRSLLPGLLAVRKTNQDRGHTGLALAEVSRVYLPRAGDIPEERRVLALVDDRGFDHAKGAVEAILAALRISGASFAPAALSALQNETAARVVLDGKTAGFVGMISEDLRRRYDLRAAPAVAELDADALRTAAPAERRFEALPRFPTSLRDLAVVVDESVLWGAVRDAVTGAGIPDIEAITFFDVYRGNPVPAGKKSIAFSLTFRSRERTLTDADVDASVAKILAALKEKTGAVLRA